MSTALHDSNPGAGLSPTETIDVAARQHAAQRAFAAADFATTIAELADIPAALRTPDLQRLLDRAMQPSEAADHRESAREALRQRDFGRAIAQIEQIPELQRDTELRELLKQAQRAAVSSAAMAAAKACLQEYRYAEAVKALETIPLNARDAEAIVLYTDAAKKSRMVDEINAALEAKWEPIRHEPTSEKLQLLRPMVLKLLELQPNNQQAQQRLNIIDGCDYYISCLQVIQTDVPKLIAAGKHLDAMQQLETIPEELRSAEISEMYAATAETVAEVQGLGREMISTVSTVEVMKLLEPIARLQTLQANPVELLRTGLLETEFQLIVRSAIRQSLKNPESSPVFEQIMAGLQPNEFCDVLNELDPEQMALLPDYEAVIAQRIGRVLEQFDQFPLTEAERHFHAIQRFQRILPDSHDCLCAWERLFKAIAGYRKLHDRNWTRRECLLENEGIELLNDRAEELALAASAVYRDKTDWLSGLQAALGKPASPECFSLKRVALKMRVFQKTGRWPTTSLAKMTRQRLTRIAAGLFAVVAFGLGGKILYSLVFGLGGLIGSILALFVVSLWTFFCVLLSRSM